ncbi:MAG: hypothetical protein IANPNBLG_04172 [Bryobacteraceae bacterium]|nr:hypothetical protein [Bryobacteraceae bacterium]
MEANWTLSLLMAAALLVPAAGAPPTPGKDGWVSMFDGKTLNGWKAADNPESWTVRNGAITGDGERSHLFWMGEQCENCEFRAEIRLNHGGNSGMYFRAEFVPGWPNGYEAQVNNSHKDPVRTGSLYNLVKVYDQLVPDNTWWTQDIIANGNHIIIKVNGKVTADYVDEKRLHRKGYLALQQHNKGSVVEYRNLMFRKLPPR